MRFILTQEAKITLTMLESGLQQQDVAYRILPSQTDDLMGDLYLGEILCGEVQINHPDDDVFDEDIADLIDMLEYSKDENAAHILQTLDDAKSMVTISALWEDTESEPALTRIDPLWDWLFSQYQGILQADNDGFYNKDGLLLELNLKI